MLFKTFEPNLSLESSFVILLESFIRGALQRLLREAKVEDDLLSDYISGVGYW